jgi:hypothetical protein
MREPSLGNHSPVSGTFHIRRIYRKWLPANRPGTSHPSQIVAQWATYYAMTPIHTSLGQKKKKQTQGHCSAVKPCRSVELLRCNGSRRSLRVPRKTVAVLRFRAPSARIMGFPLTCALRSEHEGNRLVRIDKESWGKKNVGGDQGDVRSESIS